MAKELINLLPPERARSVKREYFLRLAVVALILLTGVVAIHTVLLFPSYLYLQQEISGKQERLAALTAATSGSEEKQVTDRVTTLDSNASYLARLATAPTASGIVRTILSVPRPGISLIGFTYAPPSQNVPGKVGIIGIATSRESLRRYNDALGAIPGVTNVDLPISAYAKETAIDFTITLTGPFTP